MNEYFIGAGAILVPGPEGFMTPTSIHAQADSTFTESVEAAAFDFEGSQTNLHRLVVAAAGWTAGTFERNVAKRLRACREATLADVFVCLAGEVGTGCVHLFARWVPDEATVGSAAARGVRIIAHPLETLARVSLVSGTRRLHWGPARAA